ncbi:6-carboxytetrahydropterin synthase QueD [Gordonia sp. NPDC062954]|uniref:6-carboxytetrahydropterin synthase QueD n=1 Tax=Gordonia sp. NPDC062954 TaxID=3364003 RepID=UPI0037C63D64
MEIFREFTFESAHRLPNVPQGHKCARLHGHSYRMTVTVEGPVDGRLGWIMDFGELKEVVQPLVRTLDHHVLNEIEGLENPTSENLAVWIWDRLSPDVRGLRAVQIRETATSGCTYYGTN